MHALFYSELLLVYPILECEPNLIQKLQQVYCSQNPNKKRKITEKSFTVANK